MRLQRIYKEIAMRKLGLLLDSDSFIDVWHTVFTGDDVAIMTKLKDDAHWGTNYYELTEHTKEGRFTFEQSEDMWMVGQVFEISDKPFALVYHHAFDGVDFELLGQYETWDEAKEARDKEIHNMIDDWQDPFNKVPDYDKSELWRKDNQISWDDGQEWHVWSIIDVSID